MDREQGKFWNPYVGGVALGLVLLATYAIMGKGLGASGASFRAGVAVVHAVAPRHAQSVPAIASALEDGNPFDDWLVFEVLGVVVGGFIGAMTSRRFGREVLKGPTFERGADLEVPGWHNRLLAASVRLVPTRTAAAIARHMLESPPSEAKKVIAA